MKLSYQITGTLLSNSLRRALVARATDIAKQRPDQPGRAKPETRSRSSATNRREKTR